MNPNLPGQLFPLVGGQSEESFRRDARQLAEYVQEATGIINSLTQKVEELTQQIAALQQAATDTSGKLNELEVEINLPPSEGGAQDSIDLYSLALITGVFQGSELEFLKTILAYNKPFNEQPIYDKIRELTERLAADTALGAGETTVELAAVKRTANAQATSVLNLKAEVEELDNGVKANAEAILAAIAQIGTIEGEVTGQLAGMSVALVNLESTVTQQGNSISANSAAIVQADAAIVNQGNRLSGGGLLSITGNASPGGGIHAEVLLAARASAWGQDSIAAISLQAYTEGGQLKTRAIHYADRTIFASPYGDYVVAPITFTGTQAYLRDVIATRIQVQSAPSGQRLVITDGIIAVYDSNGVLRVQMGVW